MNSKFYVPFETAKALKEKGYPQEIDVIHFDGRIVHRNLSTEQMAILCIVAAPTYHEVVDWLEGKGIVIGTGKARGKWYCSIDSDTDDLTTELYPTREEALNAAILVALSMI